MNIQYQVINKPIHGEVHLCSTYWWRQTETRKCFTTFKSHHQLQLTHLAVQYTSSDFGILTQYLKVGRQSKLLRSFLFNTVRTLANKSGHPVETANWNNDTQTTNRTHFHTVSTGQKVQLGYLSHDHNPTTQEFNGNTKTLISLNGRTGYQGYEKLWSVQSLVIYGLKLVGVHCCSQYCCPQFSVLCCFKGTVNIHVTIQHSFTSPSRSLPGLPGLFGSSITRNTTAVISLFTVHTYLRTDWGLTALSAQ